MSSHRHSDRHDSALPAEDSPQPPAVKDGGERRFTPVTAGALIAAGYREFAGTLSISNERRFFQKRFVDKRGTRYFLDFREWEHPTGISWDASFSNNSAICGVDYIWLTFTPHSIEQSEEFIQIIWNTTGRSYYEKDKP